MTLVSSGILHLKGSSAAPTRSIEFELEGNYTGTYHLTTARTQAGFSLPVDMTDFYGYGACSDPTPGTPSSCSGSDQGPYGRCTYGTGTNCDNYRVQYSTWPENNWLPTSGGGAYDLTSPYDVTLGSGDWHFRVCGENCSGLGPYRTSARFTMN